MNEWLPLPFKRLFWGAKSQPYFPKSHDFLSLRLGLTFFLVANLIVVVGFVAFVVLLFCCFGCCWCCCGVVVVLLWCCFALAIWFCFRCKRRKNKT